MQRFFHAFLALICFIYLLELPASLPAQSHGSIEGDVALKETGDALRGVTVLILESGRSVATGSSGRYKFERVPPGTYHLVAHLDGSLTRESQPVEVTAGAAARADFQLALQEQSYQINVTASGEPESAFESFQSVDSMNSFELAQEISPSIGETLGQKPGTGISKRSFGPGSSRPMIRGFDGDRVLIMQDGIRTGSLSSQSGDHGETLNTANLERLEVVKGPATLLYGSNALGGVVNAISRHHAVHEHPHEGFRGYLSGTGGTASEFGGGAGGFEYGIGKWMIWAGSGGHRTSDYDTPIGEVPNSRTRLNNGYAGLGWYGRKTFVSAGLRIEDGSYGVPFAEEFHGHGAGVDEMDDHAEDGHDMHEMEDGHAEEEDDHDMHEMGEDDHAEDDHAEGDEHAEELERVTLETERQSYRVNWGVRDLSKALQKFVLKLDFTRWEHDEVEVFEDGGSDVGTAFDQNQFIYRGTFEQARRGPLTGRFGFWGKVRDYQVTGEEALSPNVDENAFAVFALEEFDFERFRFQVGGRLERTRYEPGEFLGESDIHGAGEEEGEDDHAVADRDNLPDRTFTGASAALGFRSELWRGGAFLVNYAHSYRAPALEELFNFGPHVGTLSFEIGDPSLEAETGDGFEISLRQNRGRFRGDLNLFYYTFDNFVFPFATGEIEDGLQVVNFTQLDSRFMGGEATLDVALRPNLWLNFGADFVDAQETANDTPLPRIPPLRGKAGFDFRYRGLSVRPEVILASSQQQTFAGETRTPGYTVVNLKASYTIPSGNRVAHQFAVNVFNIGDRLYRNHSSFIKDLAPEIGRGVRFTYKVRFF